MSEQRIAEVRQDTEEVLSGKYTAGVTAVLWAERCQILLAHIAQLAEVVDAVKPISDACWDSEYGEWIFLDNDIINLRDKYAALSEQGEKE